MQILMQASKTRLKNHPAAASAGFSVLAISSGTLCKQHPAAVSTGCGVLATFCGAMCEHHPAAASTGSSMPETSRGALCKHHAAAASAGCSVLAVFLRCTVKASIGSIQQPTHCTSCMHYFRTSIILQQPAQVVVC
jgi:hypothetical protein